MNFMLKHNKECKGYYFQIISQTVNGNMQSKKRKKKK